MEKSTFTREYAAMRLILRERREAAGITQIALAEKLQETQSYVSKVERGERRLDLVQLKCFCEAIGLGLAEFIVLFEAKLRKKSGKS